MPLKSTLKSIFKFDDDLFLSRVYILQKLLCKRAQNIQKLKYYFPDDYNGGGWVRNVSSWEDFADSINESFGLFFNKIPVEVNIKSTAFSDPREVNDQFEVILKPIP